jgi:presenilin-like A22 family membrane protease
MNDLLLLGFSIGYHGNSIVVTWSNTTIAFHPLLVVVPAGGLILFILWCMRVQLPWLIIGAVVGMGVGYFFMPHEARIGLPLSYAACPVVGAIAGVVIAAILESTVRSKPRAPSDASDTTNE